MQFVDRSLQSGESARELLGRFYRASAGIVMGRDQRYKRNREGNPPSCSSAGVVWVRAIRVAQGQAIDEGLLSSCCNKLAARNAPGDASTSIHARQSRIYIEATGVAVRQLSLFVELKSRSVAE